MASIITDPNIRRTLRVLLTDGFISETFMGTSGSRMKFLFSWPPSILDESRYANPWSATNPGGSMAAVENISALVDPVPAWNDIYYPSGHSLESIYRHIILPANPVGKAVRRALRSCGPASDTSLSDQEFEEIKEMIPRLKTDDSERRRSVLEAREKLRSVVSSGLVNLERIEKIEKDNITKINQPILRRAVVQDDPILPVERVLLYANSLVARSERSRIDSPFVTYCPSNIFPLHFIERKEVSEWVHATFSCLNDNDVPVDVSIKFSRIDIERPWLVDYLFNMNGWTIPGQDAGWLSNGSLESNTGLLPLIPVSFIVCRDFIIQSKSEILFQALGVQILMRCCMVTPFMAPC